MTGESLGVLRAGRLPCFLLLFSLLGLGGLGGCGTKLERDSEQALPMEEATDEVGSVEFKFVFDAERETTVKVEGVRAGDTVLDCMKKIEEPKIVVNGSGQNAFVASIGDKDTSAGEGWSYRVNDQWADRSVGVYEIQPGAVVIWSYGGFEAGE